MHKKLGAETKLVNRNYGILIHTSLKFVPKYSINITSSLVRVMAWSRAGDTPLPEPILTQIYDSILRHYGTLS